MKVGDKVYVVTGIDVDEWEVYQIDDKGEPWIRNGSGFGMRANHYLNQTFLSVDGAVFHAKANREREIKRLASRLTRLAINPKITVKLMKIKRTSPTKRESP